MANLTGERFLDVLRQSNLVAEEQLGAALLQYEAARGKPALSDAQALSDFLVEKQLITTWQTRMLLEGRHRGFFLGNYKLLSHLGSGGMSSVYLAEHKHMKQRRAVKVLPRNRVNDSSYLARFYREARAAAALDHPNIVRAYDVDNDGDNHYLVMEFVEGRDLQQLVQRDGPPPYEEAIDYVSQAARGLAHAHEVGLIHRDIKPANLLVDQRGTVKVLDMGLARFNDDAQASLTVAHEENVLGTADYLAPEQALNSHSVDHRADIYSLGCTLYFLLTGHPPFPEGTLAQRLLKHQTTQPPSILIDRPDCPQALVDVCSRMMAKNADERFQTAFDVEDALAALLTTSSAARSGSRVPGRGSDVGKTQTGTSRVPRAAPIDRPPGVHDTVSNFDQGTIKGPARIRGDSSPSINIAGGSSKRKIPQAQSLATSPQISIQGAPRSSSKLIAERNKSGAFPSIMVALSTVAIITLVMLVMALTR